MTSIKEETQGQLTALAARTETFSARAKRFVLVCIVLAAGAACAALIASALGPDAKPSSIDIPETVLQLFSADVPGGVTVDGAVFSGSEALGKLSPGATVMVIIVIGIAIALALARASTWLFIMGWALAALIVVMDIAFNASGGPQRSQRDDFVRAVEQHQVEPVAEHLKAVNQRTTPAGLYVLAQVSIAEGENRLPINDDLVREFLSSGAGFTPSGKALYAIEHAAYGAPKSAVAVAYQHEREGRQQWAGWVAIALGGLCAVAGSTALALLAARHALRQRLGRIREMLG